MMSYDYPHPVSRTYQYKKITKPLLERKRRARINRCLDELKDLMVDALETEGENISKLEKADILELTVRHLQRLQASRPSGLSTAAIPGEDSSENRWRSGFGHCAAEACRFLTALPGEAADRLARHLASGLQATRQLEVQVSQKGGNSPPLSPMISRSLPPVSPTLSSLEKTAKLLAPSAVSPGGNSNNSSSSSNSNSNSNNTSSNSPSIIVSPISRHSSISSQRTTAHPYYVGKTVNNMLINNDRPIGSPCQIVKETNSQSVNNVGKNNNNNNNNNNIEIPIGSHTGRGSADVGKVTGIMLIQNVLPTVDQENLNHFTVQPVADVASPTSTHEDDEEIDVENIDESDPMWRPW